MGGGGGVVGVGEAIVSFFSKGSKSKKVFSGGGAWGGLEDVNCFYYFTKIRHDLRCLPWT